MTWSYWSALKFREIFGRFPTATAAFAIVCRSTILRLIRCWTQRQSVRTHHGTSLGLLFGVPNVAISNDTEVVQFGLGVTNQLVDVLALAYRTLSSGTSGSGQDRQWLVEQVVARGRHFGWVAVGESRHLGELGVLKRGGVA